MSTFPNGAVIALLVAQQRPELVSRMILIGQYYSSSGKTEGSELIAALGTAEGITMLRRGYDPFTPDGPDHFPIVHAKIMQMITTEPEIELGALGAIGTPTLVLQGDRDEVAVEHSLAVVRTLQNARLAVLPGTHALPVERPDLVNPLISTFMHDMTPSVDWSAFTG